MGASVVTDASGERLYIVGDIHGCYDETRSLVRFVEEGEGLTQNDIVVFLGDYIDRGPKSRDVIELMLEFQSKFPNTKFMKGNHEDMLMDFLGFGGRLGQAFLYNGGLETIQSYGISVFASPEEMAGAIPPEHLAFFSGLHSILRIEKFICAHAGLNPLRDLESQNDGDVLWIRDEFISNVHSFNATIVFGHTPYRDILLHLPYKVGIDTGLVFGNKLTCLELRSGKLFQIAKGESSVVKSTVVLTADSNSFA